MLTKSATVTTNDPKLNTFILSIRGQVEVFATLSPKFIRLSGPAGEKIIREVRITPSPKYPFKITKVLAQPANTSKFSFTYEKVKNSPNKQSLLTVTNLQNEPGSYAGSIVLYTDSVVRPKLTVQVNGNIYEPFVKNPPSPPKKS